MTGEVVAVLRKAATYDELRNPTEAWEREEVADVLVSPGGASDVTGSTRPDGTKAQLTLAFPKGYSKSLRNCRVEVGGELFEVVGDPRPNQLANCPTRWWYTVSVEAVNG